jgi:hypothetical protein
MDHPPKTKNPKTKIREQDGLTPIMRHANHAPGLFFAIHFIGLGGTCDSP